jgi:hypothetical protein
LSAQAACRCRAAALVLLVVALAAAETTAQGVTVASSPDGLHVRAPGFRFLDGPVLQRLRDGQSVRIDFTLEVLASRAGRALARGEQRVNVSFDIWEQRFAVTRAGSPLRSVSQLTATAAEAWCLENLVIPTPELGRIGTQPFWVRIVQRVIDSSPPRETADQGPFGVLIEAFSRRRSGATAGRPLEAGPFRLP